MRSNRSEVVSIPMKSPSSESPAVDEAAILALVEEVVSLMMRHLGAPTGTRLGVSDLVDTAQAANIIGIKPQSLRVWRHQQREGQPPHIRLPGGRIRYSKAALEAFVKSRTRTY